MPWLDASRLALEGSDPTSSRDLDDSLDQAGLLLRPERNGIDRARQRGPVGDQAIDRDVAVSDRGNHALEIFGRRVAAAQQGHFFSVKVGVLKRDRVLDHSYQHV